MYLLAYHDKSWNYIQTGRHYTVFDSVSLYFFIFKVATPVLDLVLFARLMNVFLNHSDVQPQDSLLVKRRNDNY